MEDKLSSLGHHLKDIAFNTKKSTIVANIQQQKPKEKQQDRSTPTSESQLSKAVVNQIPIMKNKNRCIIWLERALGRAGNRDENVKLVQILSKDYKIHVSKTGEDAIHHIKSNSHVLQDYRIIVEEEFGKKTNKIYFFHHFLVSPFWKHLSD